jgi:hypothetical protein
MNSDVAMAYCNVPSYKLPAKAWENHRNIKKAKRFCNHHRITEVPNMKQECYPLKRDLNTGSTDDWSAGPLCSP